MSLVKLLVLGIIFSALHFTIAEDDVEEFDFAPKSEREYYYEDYDDEAPVETPDVKRYSSVGKHLLKPTGITNSHRPQYNLDAFEDDLYTIKPIEDLTEEDVEELIHKIENEEVNKNSIKTKEKNYFPSHEIRDKEEMIRAAVMKALERKDHIKKFAQLLPIMRAMSTDQRLALASLVANQVTTPPGRKGLNLVQVRSMFGNNDNTTADLMLPILLDMANLFRKASRPGKEQRSVMMPGIPRNLQMLKRSDDGETMWDDDPRANATLAVENDIKELMRRSFDEDKGSNDWVEATENTSIQSLTTTKIPDTITTEKSTITNSLRSKFSARSRSVKIQIKNAIANKTAVQESKKEMDNRTQPLKPTLNLVFPSKLNKSNEITSSTESKNSTTTEDSPIAEKLRAANRFVDRRPNPNRRQQWSPGNSKPNEASRRGSPDLAALVQRRRPSLPKKLQPVDKSMYEQGNCELFTNTLCLDADNYPTEAIVTSIRRNKAAAGALLADFKDLDQVDGVSAAEESKYTPEHYLNLNRRGDSGGSVRDFAGAGEAGFMCPSTVKYARPQRARATSGQWKYIVNTGEHTQTLRLEKCLKPKESCTYLTDNFKSKCVQVYNYHRLLTWDQQNGLHMDIFKVPTCCSCHIDGYSVSFPPLGHRVQETSSEQYPGDDVNVNENAFESGQSSIVRPNIHTTPFSLTKPVETFNMFGDSQNSISGSGFNSHTYRDNEDYNSAGRSPTDSYGNSYFNDNFKQGSSIKNIKKPTRNQIPDGMFESTVTLPSYLEPPSESSMPVVASTYFGKGPESGKVGKYPMKYLRPVKRPSRRPIRKKISGADDLIGSGTMQVESQSPTSVLQHFDDVPIDDAVVYDIQNNKANSEPPRKLIHKLPLYTSTTASYPSTKNDDETIGLKDVNKRVNYNYHPIIDFFENNSNKDETYASIDRGDSLSTFNPDIDSDWRPMSLPS